MTLSLIKSQNIGHVRVIHWVRPPESFAESVALFQEFSELCSEIGWDETTRVVLLAGTEAHSFSMGIDLARGAGQAYEDEKKFYGLGEGIASVDRPVIASIAGDATGLGLELALACDIRIAVETSRFGLPHIKKGLIPWDGGTQRLARLVGRGKALEMILTGELIGAQEALRIGLVNRVVPEKDLMDVAMSAAQEMASRGPLALRYAKEAIYKGMDMTLDQGLRLEADLYLLLHSTRDRTEGITAFREKRTPKFEGK